LLAEGPSAAPRGADEGIGALGARAVIRGMAPCLASSATLISWRDQRPDPAANGGAIRWRQMATFALQGVKLCWSLDAQIQCSAKPT